MLNRRRTLTINGWRHFLNRNLTLRHHCPHQRQIRHLNPLVGRVRDPRLGRQPQATPPTGRWPHDHQPVDSFLAEQPMVARMPRPPAPAAPGLDAVPGFPADHSTEAVTTCSNPIAVAL